MSLEALQGKSRLDVLQEENNDKKSDSPIDKEIPKVSARG